MKKKILLVAALQLFLTLGACSSDSGNDATPPVEEIKGEITIDYAADITYADDFVIGNDNLVYKIGGNQSSNESVIKLKKIDLTGAVSTFKDLDYFNYLFLRLATSNDGTILLLTGNNSNNSNKIFQFGNNFSELNPFHTIKPISSPFASKIGLSSICNNNDNTLFVFDYSNKQMKRVLPALGTDVFVAGSGKKEIKDGTGLNVGFSNVTKMISQNNIVFLIDEIYPNSEAIVANYSIRKLESLNNDWKVTTLISNATDRYTDIALDANNDLYVLIKGKGVFKLNTQDNSLISFKEGDIKIFDKKKNNHVSIGSGSFDMMKIKGNDIYLASTQRLIKISDFQTKFANAAK